jgi:hypothetical protein
MERVVEDILVIFLKIVYQLGDGTRIPHARKIVDAGDGTLFPSQELNTFEHVSIPIPHAMWSVHAARFAEVGVRWCGLRRVGFDANGGDGSSQIAKRIDAFDPVAFFEQAFHRWRGLRLVLAANGQDEIAHSDAWFAGLVAVRF